MSRAGVRWERARGVTDAERREGAVRYDCLKFAMQTAARGEDALAILARAHLYADFILPADLSRHAAHPSARLLKRATKQFLPQRPQCD